MNARTDTGRRRIFEQVNFYDLKYHQTKRKWQVGLVKDFDTYVKPEKIKRSFKLLYECDTKKEAIEWANKN